MRRNGLSGGVEQHRPGAAVARRLTPLVGDLEHLQAEVEAGVKGHAHFDALEERAQAIATGIRAAFRQGRVL